MLIYCYEYEENLFSILLNNYRNTKILNYFLINRLSLSAKSKKTILLLAFLSI